MLGEHHDLLHELPEYRDKIHDMKVNNTYFSKLFDEYHTLDHEVRRIEQGIETPSDDYTDEVKKKRLALKDELFRMLQAA